MDNDEDFVKVCVTLTNEQIVWLDRKASAIREKTKQSVSRSEMIRLFIDEGIIRQKVATEMESR